MYKVHYDENTGEIKGYYPTKISYPGGVPEPNISIEQKEHTKANSGEFIAIVKNEKIKFEKIEAEVFSKERLLVRLDFELQNQTDELKQAFTIAQIRKDTYLQSEIREELDALDVWYQEMTVKIQSGENPWEE